MSCGVQLHRLATQAPALADSLKLLTTVGKNDDAFGQRLFSLIP
jgi:hypothetical protein